MSVDEANNYLNALEEPKRTTLLTLRETILDVMPQLEQGLSYKVPAFRWHGTVIAGFAAFTSHLSYLPHSGSVFLEMEEELHPYSKSRGALRFSVDRPLPREIAERLITVRLKQAFPEHQ